MHGRLDGKIAIITGAGQGIGAAIVQRFMKEGAMVIASDITAPSHTGTHSVALDVRHEDAWTRVVADVVGQYGRIDILVNNAGIVGSYESVGDFDADIWQQVIAVNQTGTFLGMRAVIPVMLKHGYGTIINVCSIWGSVGAAGVAAYAASKGAVRNLTKSAALSYAKAGIRVNSLHPGLIATPLTDAQTEAQNAGILAQTPMGRFGRPEEIAAGCVFLASDDASFITGSELVIDGGYLAQ